jgi:hypothetical protein
MALFKGFKCTFLSVTLSLLALGPLPLLLVPSVCTLVSKTRPSVLPRTAVG